jgi:radical SAM superfamily enzyme YgiQ (UPF0313 family)
MARMTFLAPTPPDLSAFGVRALSAYLRSAGHETRLVFIPGSIGKLLPDGSFAYHYSDAVTDRAAELCAGSDLVGVSFMTPYFDRAVQLTEAVRRTGVPVVWGGIHPTIKPAEALEYADCVCVGEGEYALDALLKRRGESMEVPGVWTRAHGAAGNGMTSLVPDLDVLPQFDFSNQDHYVLDDGGNAHLLDDPLLETYLPRVPGPGGCLRVAYRTMTDRGCPHNCAYCSVPAVKRMFHGDTTPYYRQRSPGHVLDELEAVARRFPALEAIQFFDDTFFAKPLAWFNEFAPEYKRRIGLPFYCQASPGTLHEDTLALLLDAGLEFVEMGIQTGSRKMREVFRRADTDATVIAGARLLAARRSLLLPPIYHVIIDSPWETEDDLLETVRLLARLPKPFGLAISGLTFFPGTELHGRAVAEGLIVDETAQIYRRPFYVPPRKTYAGFLLYLLTFQHMPTRLVQFLLRDAVVAFFRRVQPAWLYWLGYGLGEMARLGGKGVQAVAAGDFRRIGAWVRTRFGGDRGPAGRMGE